MAQLNALHQTNKHLLAAVDKWWQPGAESPPPGKHPSGAGWKASQEKDPPLFCHQVYLANQVYNMHQVSPRCARFVPVTLPSCRFCFEEIL